MWFSACIYMCVTVSSSVRWCSLHRAYSGHGQTERERQTDRDRKRERESEVGKKKSEQKTEQELMLWALTEKTPFPLRRGQSRRQERRREERK